MSSAGSPVRRPAASNNVVDAQARSSGGSTAAAPIAGHRPGGLDRADIPRLDTNMNDIEGLKPTLLSRLFEFILPKR